jgi:Family of unknown function (DUF6703)
VARPQQKRSGNPAVRASPPSGQPTSVTRDRLSARSRGLLVRLSQLPPIVVPGAVLVLMLVGLMAPLYAAIPALLVVGLFVLWLAYLSWPLLDARGRLLRGVMVGAVIAAMAGRITGWL